MRKLVLSSFEYFSGLYIEKFPEFLEAFKRFKYYGLHSSRAPLVEEQMFASERFGERCRSSGQSKEAIVRVCVLSCQGFIVSRSLACVRQRPLSSTSFVFASVPLQAFDPLAVDGWKRFVIHSQWLSGMGQSNHSS